MCLAIVALHAHPRYRLIVAANRDEFHTRAADPAAWWDDEMLAGRDRVALGTWLGVTRRGRWALLTNFREASPRDPAAPSRGGIVAEALRDRTSPLARAATVARDGMRYHGFNLLIGDSHDVAYTSNRTSGALRLRPGMHGLSNHLLDTPWPKVRRAQAALARCIADDGVDIDPIFALLADRTPAAPEHLPSTGVSTRWEEVLSSVFIATADYGTRCSTVLTITRGGAASFFERTFDASGTAIGDVAHSFTVA
jgi:uncharacterized protein with NRDE domain